MRPRQLMAIAVATFAIGCSGIPGPDEYVLAVPGMH